MRRQFAQTREYHETVMARRYFQALQEGLPNQIFRRDGQVGTEEYHVTVPIVSLTCGSNGEPRRAVKPLDLRREEPTQVLDHGDVWIQKLRRLRARGRNPERFIVAVRQPEVEECVPAAAEIVAGLIQAGADVIEAEDTERLLELAAE